MQVFIHIILILLTIGCYTAHGFPSDFSDTGVHQSLKRDVECDPLSKYTVQWFLDNVCKNPLPSTCLFYTGGVVKQARAFADSQGDQMVTIWDIWPQWTYNDDTEDPNNRLRCIFKSTEDRLTYFTAMAKAMATICRGPIASVMVPDPKSVPMCGIFGQDEFPILQSRPLDAKNPKDALVDEIFSIDVKGANIETFWKRPGKGSSTTRRSHTLQQKRDHNGNTCGSGDIDVGVFDITGTLPVNW